MSKNKIIIKAFLTAFCFLSMALPNAVSCPSGQAECCSGTTLTCCPHPGYDGNGVEFSYDISACSIDGPSVTDKAEESESITVGTCTEGQTQYKYTASGCSYTTETRTCCASTGTWPEWGGTCGPESTTPISCSLSQCWNGTECEEKSEDVVAPCGENTTGTTLSRTAKCVDGSGWQYGEWEGSCVCVSDLYQLNGTYCSKCMTVQGVQTYYITSVYGGTCCQPRCCQTGTCKGAFPWGDDDPCCHSDEFDY